MCARYTLTLDQVKLVIAGLVHIFAFAPRYNIGPPSTFRFCWTPRRASRPSKCTEASRPGGQRRFPCQAKSLYFGMKGANLVRISCVSPTKTVPFSLAPAINLPFGLKAACRQVPLSNGRASGKSDLSGR